MTRLIFYISKNIPSEEKLKRWGCHTHPLTALQHDELVRSLQMPALVVTPWEMRDPNTNPPDPSRFGDEATIVHSRVEALEHLMMHVLVTHSTAETRTWEVGAVLGADIPLHDGIVIFNHIAGSAVNLMVETPSGDLATVMMCGRETGTDAGAGGFLKFLESVLGQAARAGGGVPDRSKMN